MRQSFRECVWVCVLIAGLTTGCASSSKRPLPKKFTSNACSAIYPTVNDTQLEDHLDRISDLFNRACFNEVITLGEFVRRQGHDKFYQLSSEFGEVFTPEGTFTDYTMESYERAYLSLLIAMSYYNLHQEAAVQVELRRSLEEDSSLIYNYGSDPIVALLLGAIWDRYDPAIARPYWKKVSESPGQDPSIQKMARARLKEIDASAANKISWRIYGIGNFPELDWQSDFIKQQQGPYKITSKQAFPPHCSSEQSLLVPTSPWVQKIGMKYKSSYHPFLFAKSLVRLPIGIGYGVIGVTGGVGVGVGGCALAASAASQGRGDGAGEFCGESIKLAGYLIGQTSNLVEFTLKPDLRHWKKVPMAFYVTRENVSADNETCLRDLKLVTQKTVYLIE